MKGKNFVRRNGYTANNILLLLSKFRKIRAQNTERNAFYANNTIKNMPEQICLTLLHRIIGSVP